MAAESPLFPCACGGQRPRAAVPPPTGLEPVLPEEPEEFRRTRFAAPGRACRHGGNRSPAAADRPAAGHDQDLLVGSHVVVEDVVDGDEGTLGFRDVFTPSGGCRGRASGRAGAVIPEIGFGWSAGRHRSRRLLRVPWPYRGP